MLLPPEYAERVTLVPLLREASVMAMPPKCDVPPLTLTPDCRDGCEAAETTRPEPALEGVRKEKVLSAMVRAYHVEALHDVAA